MTVALVAAAVLLGALAVAVWRVRRRYLLVTVRGTSMRPTLEPGDRVLVDRTAAPGATTGDLVAVRHPLRAGAGAAGADRRAADRDGTLLVKRLAAVAGERIPEEVPAPPGGGRTVPAGTVVLLGDGQHSLDSRAWGCVPRDRIAGMVVRRVGGDRPAPR